MPQLLNQEFQLHPETIPPPEGWSTDLEHIEEVGILQQDQRYQGIRIVHTLNSDLQGFRVQLTEHWHSPMFGEGEYDPGTLTQRILEQNPSLPENVGLQFLILRTTPQAVEQELLTQLSEGYPNAWRISRDGACTIPNTRQTLIALQETSFELLIMITKSLRNLTIFHPSRSNPVNLNITACIPVPFFQKNSAGVLCIHYKDPYIPFFLNRPGLYIPRDQLQQYRRILAQLSSHIPRDHPRIAFNMLPYALDAVIRGKSFRARNPQR